MIISRKRFKEKVQQEIENAEKERYIFERIDRVNRECEERLIAFERHLCAMDEKIARILDKKKR